jgi:hypothetical protein
MTDWSRVSLTRDSYTVAGWYSSSGNYYQTAKLRSVVVDERTRDDGLIEHRVTYVVDPEADHELVDGLTRVVDLERFPQT